MLGAAGHAVCSRSRSTQLVTLSVAGLDSAARCALRFQVRLTLLSWSCSTQPATRSKIALYAL